jgi:lysophospholipase L1-like esterase
MLLLALLACSPDGPPTVDAPALEVAAKRDTAHTGAGWSPCPASPCRVMPLGDSITDGYNVPGGYRIRLEDLALADGHSVDFVGSLVNGPADLVDQDHEGHSGWRIDEIQSIISARLSSYDPDIVLLHIGTNDAYQNFAVGRAGAHIARLIRTITAYNPDALVIVSSIIPMSSPALERRGARINTQILTQVGVLQAAGEHVEYVDLHAALTSADLADGVHPNRTGYDKMADGWYAALEPWLP